MKLKLPRRRWLLIACLAAVAIAAITGSQVSGPSGRFTREQYDRIRFGMTPVEVASVMGCPPSGPVAMYRFIDSDFDLAADVGEPAKTALDSALWCDESLGVMVYYHNGKVALKQMLVRVPTWKVKAREWLYWLRGLVGW
jgi:hypothetical protein